MENPLRVYLEEHSVETVAEMTKLTANTIRNISRMLPEEVGGCYLSTYVIFKDKLGIDLTEYYLDKSMRQENAENN